MVVALLATLKAGGAYVPLDPAYPAERLATCWKTARRWSCSRRARRWWEQLSAGLPQFRWWIWSVMRGNGPARSEQSGSGAIGLDARSTGLYDLYLGLHRAAQGSDGRPSWSGQPAAVGCSKSIGLAGESVAAADAVQLSMSRCWSFVPAADIRSAGWRWRRPADVRIRRLLAREDRKSRTSLRCTLCHRCCSACWRYEAVKCLSLALGDMRWRGVSRRLARRFLRDVAGDGLQSSMADGSGYST